MNTLLKPLAIMGLLLTIIPPVLLFLGLMENLQSVKNFMFAGMIVWFAATPWLALRKGELDTSTQDQI